MEVPSNRADGQVDYIIYMYVRDKGHSQMSSTCTSTTCTNVPVHGHQNVQKLTLPIQRIKLIKPYRQMYIL